MCVCVFVQAEDVNRTLEGGRKPLHYAADCGQNEMLEFLLSKGADVNVTVLLHTHTHTLAQLCVFRSISAGVCKCLACGDIRPAPSADTIRAHQRLLLNYNIQIENRVCKCSCFYFIC